AEHLCAARPCLVLREIQHHDPVERLGHDFLRFESLQNTPPTFPRTGPADVTPSLQRCQAPTAGVGAPFEAPITASPPEGRPGSAGPSPSAGAWGGRDPL